MSDPSSTIRFTDQRTTRLPDCIQVGTLHGQKVYYDGGVQQFFIQLKGKSRIYAASMAEMTQAVQDVLTPLTVEHLNRGQVERYEIIGTASRWGRPLARNHETGRYFTTDRERDGYYVGLTDEEKARYAALYTEQRRAEMALSTFLNSLRPKLVRNVQHADLSVDDDTPQTGAEG